MNCYVVGLRHTYSELLNLCVYVTLDDDGVWRLFFGVKYYIEDPSVFKEDITRYQYVLQVCRDIKVQRYVSYCMQTN